MSLLINSTRCSIITKEINSQLYNIDNYIAGNFRVIVDGCDDVEVSTTYSFEEWIDNIKKFPLVKIEGMEDNKTINFVLNKYIVGSIHVFITNKTGYSFNWHKDKCTVLLLVLQGKKIVNIMNKKTTIKQNEFVVIKRGEMHRVFSTKGTIALSIGIK